MAKQKKNLSGDVYYPSEKILESSRVSDYDCLYKLSIEDREGFWEKEAGKLSWFKKFSTNRTDCTKIKTFHRNKSVTKKSIFCWL